MESHTILTACRQGFPSVLKGNSRKMEQPRHNKESVGNFKNTGIPTEVRAGETWQLIRPRKEDLKAVAERIVE